jgi:hypothetical protein
VIIATLNNAQAIMHSTGVGGFHSIPATTGTIAILMRVSILGMFQKDCFLLMRSLVLEDVYCWI